LHNRITMETKYTSTLTISIPAYNDAKSLPCIFNDYMEIKHEINIPSTLLIINDGSNDNTYEIMQDIISNN
jgi:glycosyltransferase involved in cell wall biosynthesis